MSKCPHKDGCGGHTRKHKTVRELKHKFVLCRFYLFLKYRRVNVQKDKEFHQELYNIYTPFFSFFLWKIRLFSK